MMRRVAITALASCALGLSLSVASAADLPSKAAPMLPPPPPPYNWTGFYVGGHLGAGWARNDLNDTSVDIAGFNFFPPDRSLSNGVGVLGGVTLGYNWQLPNSPIVLGI